MIGIIIEANPFHNGHKYFIDKIKKDHPEDGIIAVTSTSFTMRGEISVIDKFQKTSYLLDAGVNLVMELPTAYALESGDKFAYNSVKILSLMGVDEIICGSEDENLDNVINLYSIINDQQFIKKLKSNLKLHLSYKETFSKTLNDLNIDGDLINLFNQPNFTLAYQYYSSIMKINPNIKLTLIKRIKDDNILSATKLKEMILNNQSINEYLPFNESIINYQMAINNFNTLINYKITLSRYNDSLYQDEINYLFNLDHIDINNSSNKIFSNSRIRRAAIRQLLEYSNIENINYLRLLGADSKGLKYIKSLDKSIKKIIFSSPKEITNIETFDILKIELKSLKLYEQLTNESIMIKEYQLPIKKE